MYHGTHFRAQHHFFDVTTTEKVENHYGQLVFHAERDGRRIHHAQALFQDLKVGELLEQLGGRI